MNAEEKDIVNTALAQLKAVANSDDEKAIAAEIKSLEKSCEFYVERRMNQSVRHAMAGHNLNEFE